ncbi:hypothetical protein FJY69_07835 [candidate division WOR-3 bacterium]|nr:hypothetical protein [candidate division WOR-3 bacterium]
MRVMMLMLVMMSRFNGAWVSIGPDGGNIQALAIDPQGSATLYAIPYESPDLPNPRVFTSSDGGTTWSLVGRLACSAATSVEVDPHERAILYSFVRGSQWLWRSTNSGATWSAAALPGTGALPESDPLAPGRVYVAGYYRAGNRRAALFISTDYGLTWSVSTPDAASGTADACAADPVNSGTVYLGCTSGRVYRSTDAGGTWSLRNSGLPPEASIQALSVNSGNPSIVLAATAWGSYRSTDAGTNWAPVASLLLPLRIEFSPAIPSVAFAVGYTDSAQFFVSSDFGASWSVPPPGIRLDITSCLVADPESGDVAYVTSRSGVYKTLSRGASWQTAHGGMRIARIATIAVSPENGERVYVECAENGVFRSSDGGGSWVRCGDFLSCGQICGIGVAPVAHTDILYALEGKG